MIKNEKVTVVLPIYNVEKYLERCIKSVINQTYKNLEIILVDDGSTDSSSKICDTYKEKDKRIKVVHQKNAGLSAARNSGMRIATSNYICFIDSDDYIENDMIEYLYNGMKKYDSKITCCGFTNVYENGTLEKITKPKSDIIYTKEEALNIHLFTGYIEVVAWNKLYDISLFKEIQYPEGKLYEDMLTTYKLIGIVDKVVLLPECKYFYCKRKSSIGGSKFSEKTLGLIDAVKEVSEYVSKNKYDNKRKDIKIAEIQWNIVVLNKMLIADEINKDIYLKIKKMILKQFGYLMINKQLSFMRKVQNCILMLFPLNVYKKMYFKFLEHNR